MTQCQVSQKLQKQGYTGREEDRDKGKVGKWEITPRKPISWSTNIKPLCGGLYYIAMV